MAGVGEFVFRQAPRLQRFPVGRRHPGVGRQEPDQALLPTDVLADDALTGRVVAIRVRVVAGHEVEADRVLVVGIALAVGHDHARRLLQQVVAQHGVFNRPPLRILGEHGRSVQVARHEFIFRGIVVGGRRERHAVFRHVRQTEPVTIRLHAVVPRAFGAGAAVLHAEDEPARRIARTAVRIDGAAEIVRGGHGAAPQQVRLVAVAGLAELGFRLPPHAVGHAGASHDVTLVGGVDEHAAGKSPARLRHERGDGAVARDDSGFEVEPLARHKANPRVAQQAVKNLLRHMWLEKEHHVFRRIVVLATERLGALVAPGGRGRVVLFHPTVEFAGESADRLFPADVGGAEPATGQAADVPAWFDQNDALARPGRSNRGGHAGGGPAVNHDVVVRDCGRGAAKGGEEEEAEQS